jgi:hypothetical protein
MGVPVLVGVDVGLAIGVYVEVRVGVIVGVDIAVAIGVYVEGGGGDCVGDGDKETISICLAQAANMAIGKRIYSRRRNDLCIMLPPFDLGIPQIIHLYKTIALFGVKFNRLGKVFPHVL